MRKDRFTNELECPKCGYVAWARDDFAIGKTGWDEKW
jgi:hypothetical protein